MDGGDRVAAVEEVPEESSFLFTVRELATDETREAILLRVGGDASVGGPAGNGTADGSPTDGPTNGVAAWLNYCQHFTHIRLDKGSGVEYRDGEVICTNHGAMFDAGSGLCTFGPCEGAYLEAIEVGVEDGVVYLTDDDYEFVRAGPTEKDPLDLSSKSNVEF